MQAQSAIETLWPVPLWWAGFRTQYQSELRKLEGLAEQKSELTEVWRSYGGRSGRVKVMITPTPAARYAVILVAKD
jgi:hypothetical protein